MKILVDCEFSGVVRRAFRERGHDAWSCDLLPCSDASPYHIQRDVMSVIDQGWDMMIAFPPCTYLCGSGMHWTTRGMRDPALTEQAVEFVRTLMIAKIKRIAIENPIGIISTRIRKPNQIIQPYEFGHDASKRTCLWLDGLTQLRHTKRVPGRVVCQQCGCASLPGSQDAHDALRYGCGECGALESKQKERWSNQTDSGQNKLGPSDTRWADRSVTYEGIAMAMATQWTR